MSLRPLNSQNSLPQNLGQINDMVRQLNHESQTKTFNGANGKPAVTIGKLASGDYGLSFSDGTITFLTITQDGIILNDGTTDRILIGKDVGGF